MKEENIVNKNLFSIVARPDHQAERENREKMRDCDASRKESDLQCLLIYNAAANDRRQQINLVGSKFKGYHEERPFFVVSSGLNVSRRRWQAFACPQASGNKQPVVGLSLLCLPTMMRYMLIIGVVVG